jgi:hypothetical protein
MLLNIMTTTVAIGLSVSHVWLFISFYHVQLSNQIQHLQRNLNHLDLFTVLYQMKNIKYHSVNSLTI